MAHSADSPTLFLSHSGQQKGFVQRLYQELVHVNHNVFFDQDTQISLPKGTYFPSRIFDACRSCKLGVVVLSHDYMESMWPMLELQQFLFHNPCSPNNVLPIFYRLKPTDLRDPVNLERWKSSWEKRVPRWHESNRDWHPEGSSQFMALTLNMDKWPDALQMLRHQNGEIFPDNKDERAFIQTIVSNICKRFPPPKYFIMGDHFKGAESIQKEIHELFQKQQHGDHNIVDEESSRSPLAVGLYGVGGSGKTTVCNYMLQFYSRLEYRGDCCFIQFPSKKADRSLVTQSLKDVLSKRASLSETTLKGIQSVEEAMPHIKELLSRYRVFLIIDNVWDWSLDLAVAIVRMEFIQGSRLLVTARSEDLLQLLSSSLGNPEGGRNLRAMQIIHVPSISEEEAVGALKAYSLSSLQDLSNIDGLRSLAKLCFFSEQCHPLLLETVGRKLRIHGGQLRSAEDWARFLSDLQARVRGGGEVEDQIADVLRTSYDALHSLKLQNTFLKLGTCVPKSLFYSLFWVTEWLSKVSDGGSQMAKDIRSQLLELKYHGLIQIHGEEVVIHDIQMMLIDNLVQERKGEPRSFFRNGGISSLSVEEFVKLRYIYAEEHEPNEFCFNISCPQTMSRPQLEVFHLRCSQSRSGRCIDWLSVKHMQFLRHLYLSGISNLSEVGGWHGAPNLVSVEIRHCSNLQKIESMTCLLRLESVVLWCLPKYVFTVKHPRKLHRLNLSCCGHSSARVEETLSTFTSLQTFTLVGSGTVSFPNFNSTSLRALNLSDSSRLERMEGSLCGLTALEQLDLSVCQKLKSMLDLQQLVRLRELKLDFCGKLREVKLADAALTNLELLTFVSSTELTSGPCFFSTSTRSSPLPMDAFTNLRVLTLSDGIMISGYDGMDLGSIELPASLEALTIWGFRRAREFTYSSALVNLTKLRVVDCPSLKSITGLGGYFKLSKLKICDCDSLREVGHWEPPFDRYSLLSAHVEECTSLETLSNIGYLPSVTRITIFDGNSCRDGKPLFEGWDRFTQRRFGVGFRWSR